MKRYILKAYHGGHLVFLKNFKASDDREALTRTRINFDKQLKHDYHMVKLFHEHELQAIGEYV